MSDSETDSVSSSETLKQFETLERFESHRRTWELELLISGAVVFALLGVPSRLDEWYFHLDLHVSKTQSIIVFFGYYYLKLIAYALVVSFCVNLSIRAYWIGLIGLHRVFPDGIRWSEVKDGPISRQIQQQQPDLTRQIDKADKLSSLIFSTSFIIIIIFVFSILLVAITSLLAWGISALAFGGKHVQPLFYGLIAAFLVPSIVCGLVDRRLAKKPREAWEGRWFVKPIAAILRVFYWISLRPLYASIQLTLSSNIDKRIATPVFILSFTGLLGMFIGSLILQKSDKLVIHGYQYFPDVRVDRQVDFSHYESLQPAGKIFRTSPSIQSDIITDPFIKLFIPYSPGKHNRHLGKLCPDVQPVPQQGFSAQKIKQGTRPPKASTDAALDCLGSLHQISMNGELLELDFDFYSRPDSGVRGIITYISTAEIPQGRNTLHIERVATDDEDDNDPGKTEYFIPFWI